jgi:hypothetical protein
MNNTFTIPGLTKLTFKRKLGLDLLFFLAVFALPTNFFNFLPSTLFVDTRLLYLVIGILYIVFNIKSYFKLIRIPGVKLLVVVITFLVFRILYSYAFNNIPITEIITIFRTNFSYPIITFGFLLYAVKMGNKRLYRFVFWIFFVSLITSVVYVFSNLTGLSIYANVYKDYKTFEDTVIIQNLAAISRYNPILYITGIFALLTQPKFKKVHYFLVPLLVVILSNVRSQLLVYVMLLLVCIILITRSRFKLISTKFIRFLIAGLFLFLISVSLFQAHINRFIDKFGVEEVEQISTEQYLEAGTYKVRLELIEEAQDKIADNLLLGNGYVREARKGQYDYVVGSDTMVAPILYAEGYLGFIIRLLPVFFFIGFGITNIKNGNKMIVFSAIVMLSIIFASAVNIVQTRLFTNYNEIIFIFYLFTFIIYNTKRNQVLDAKKLS